jgi:hypothetical protein
MSSESFGRQSPLIPARIELPAPVVDASENVGPTETRLLTLIESASATVVAETALSEGKTNVLEPVATSGLKFVCAENVVALSVIVWLSLLIVPCVAIPRVSEFVSVAYG